MPDTLATIAELEALYGQPVEADHAALSRIYRGLAVRHAGDLGTRRARLFAARR